MYIDTVPNRNSRPTILLRKARREGKKIKKTTLDNLTKWPSWKVELLRRVLRDEALVPVGEAFATERSLPHGHVEAVLGTIRKLGLDKLISSKRCRERDLAVAMVAEQLIHPCSKLATTRLWHTTTLAEELKVQDADEDELYEAMDWLLRRQGRIEKKLAKRHLCDGSLVLYDVTSSYYEGRTCPLARFGHDRDGKKSNPLPEPLQDKIGPLVSDIPAVHRTDSTASASFTTPGAVPSRGKLNLVATDAAPVR